MDSFFFKQLWMTFSLKIRIRAKIVRIRKRSQTDLDPEH
jgi:hypothetical protein